MNRLNKTESAILLALMCSCFQRTYLIFTAVGVVQCGGRKTSPRTSLKCRLYIFWSFGIIGLILSQFEYRVPLKPVLGVGGWGGGGRSVAPLHFCTRTDSIKPSLLFSFLSCVPCFQRIIIQNLFYGRNSRFRATRKRGCKTQFAAIKSTIYLPK